MRRKELTARWRRLGGVFLAFYRLSYCTAQPLPVRITRTRSHATLLCSLLLMTFSFLSTEALSRYLLLASLVFRCAKIKLVTGEGDVTVTFDFQR